MTIANANNADLLTRAGRQPGTFAEAVVAVARAEGLDVANDRTPSRSIQRQAQCLARDRFPGLHSAWCAIGFPAIDFAAAAGRGHAGAFGAGVGAGTAGAGAAHAASEPRSYQEAVLAVARDGRLDLFDRSQQNLACAVAKVKWPRLHNGWRAAGFPAVNFNASSSIGSDPSGPRTFRDAVHRIAARDNLDLATKPGQCAAAARAAKEHRDLHQAWREEDFPDPFR